MILEQLEITTTTKKLEQLFFDSKSKVDIYKLVTEDLLIREKEELKISKDSTEIDTKYSVLRIITKYNLFTSFLAESETIDNFFLHSNEAKIRLLTSGCIFGNLNELKIDTLDNKNLISNDFVMLAPEDYDREFAFIQNNIDNLYWWRGCEMKIPNEAKITLGFNKLFFSIFIKAKETNDEIFIEESSWDITYLHNNENFVRGKNTIPSFGNITSNNAEARQKKVIINKEDIANNNSNKTDYLSVDIDILKALKDCDIVIQMPYQNPRVDALMKVKFENEKASEIILTCP